MFKHIYVLFFYVILQPDVLYVEKENKSKRFTNTYVPGKSL